MMVSSRGQEPDLQAELLEGLKIPDDGPEWERGMYHFFLGNSLLAAGKREEAIASLRKSDELYSDGMACGTLVTFLVNAGQVKEAELYARKATTLEPDRIDYWDMLQKVLYAQGKYEQADKLLEQIYLLGDLY